MRIIQISALTLLLSINCNAGDIYNGGDSPNVILIMTDDQGYGDIAAHGNPVIKTPSLDQFHSESVRFSDFHVNAFCAPTRAALMTGRMSDRTHVRTTINLRNHLNREETTMAEFFKASGYHTALFGKWHLGGNYPYRPMDRGFDQWVGHGDGGTGTSSDYWGNDKMNDHYYRNGQWEQFSGFSTDIYFTEAMKFIDQHREEPFFVYLPTNVPHGPWNVLKEWREQYMDAGLKEGQIDFYATLTHFDENFGRLREFLKAEGLDENTMVIFLTDNGTSGGSEVFNAGMKGKKGTLYEGGHRVPLMIHWPGGGLDQGMDIEAFTSHIDLLPTLIELCGLDTPARGHLEFDGRSLGALLFENDPEWSDRTLFLHTQNVREVPVKGLNSLVATSKWRLIKGEELYDIKADPGQEKNVAQLHPDVVKELMLKYDDYWAEIRPGYAPYPRAIVGSEFETETWLTPDGMIHDHARAKSAMQSFVLEGNSQGGFWPIEVAEAGTYRFDVRRWPKEINHPISAPLPGESKSDIYNRGRPVLLGEGKAIATSKVSLRVGGQEMIQKVGVDDVGAEFKVKLEEGPTLVRARLIDPEGIEGGAYYVYVTKITPDERN